MHGNFPAFVTVPWVQWEGNYGKREVMPLLPMTVISGCESPHSLALHCWRFTTAEYKNLVQSSSTNCSHLLALLCTILLNDVSHKICHNYNPCSVESVFLLQFHIIVLVHKVLSCSDNNLLADAGSHGSSTAPGMLAVRLVNVHK